jgi:hypothetical protein
MKQRKAFLLRIDPTLHEELEGWAQQELRSLNGQIEYLLKEALQRRKHGIARETGTPPSGKNATGRPST